jgi:hypothetical protein
VRWGALWLWMVLGLSGGCRAAFVDERPEGARPAGIADVSGVDLSGPVTVAEGELRGRAGHLGQGGASLVGYPSGVVELRFDAEFAVSQVSGPVVLLTGRDYIGTSINHDAGDLEIGPLQASAGAQSYFLRNDGDRRNVFIYCKPYGIEVAKALLQPTP